MERNVTSLETAKKLKAVGFPQDVEREWFVDAEGKATLRNVMPAGFSGFGLGYAAPTAQEIADQLEDGVSVDNLTTTNGQYWAQSRSDIQAAGTTMAEALAALYLRLKEDVK
jgi:hypothetical protein